jgi:predicted nucleic acid-binding Zn ribbon protein
LKLVLPAAGRGRRPGTDVVESEENAVPIYVYEVIDESGQGGETFEVLQKASDPPLTVHPETGQPVRRVIQPPFIGGMWSDHAMHRSMKDDKKLDRLGFTKYVKAGDGIYEKRAGKGPDVISKDRPIQPRDLK